MLAYSLSGSPGAATDEPPRGSESGAIFEAAPQTNVEKSLLPRHPAGMEKLPSVEVRVVLSLALLIFVSRPFFVPPPLSPSQLFLLAWRLVCLVGFVGVLR